MLLNQSVSFINPWHTWPLSSAPRLYSNQSSCITCDMLTNKICWLKHVTCFLICLVTFFENYRSRKQSKRSKIYGEDAFPTKVKFYGFLCFFSIRVSTFHITFPFLVCFKNSFGDREHQLLLDQLIIAIHNLLIFLGKKRSQVVKLIPLLPFFL